MAEDDALMPDWERFYLYRVESYLVHKYSPELVDQFTFTFRKARERKTAMVKHDENIYQTTEDLMAQIQEDILSSPFRKRNSVHKRTLPERPGIGQFYQQEYNEL